MAAVIALIRWCMIGLHTWRQVPGVNFIGADSIDERVCTVCGRYQRKLWSDSEYSNPTYWADC